MNPAFKPYLIRAFYEWVTDEGWTPHLSVIVDAHTRVPPGYIKDGQIVLNVGPNACRNFFIHNDGVSFEARFSGTVHSIWVPIGRVSSIFAREAEEGMTFDVEDTPETEIKTSSESSKPSKRPMLKVVK